MNKKPGRRRHVGPPTPRVTEPKDEAAFEDHLAVAIAALEAGNLERARAEAGEAVRLNRSHWGPFLILGEAHLLSESFRDAVEAFERALRKAEQKDDEQAISEAHWGLARARLMEGRLAEAAGYLQKLLTSADEVPVGVAQLLAEVHLRLGHGERALKLLPASEGLLPDGWLVRGFAAWTTGDHLEAQACLRRALLGNVHLVAAVMDEEPADIEFVPSNEEASKEYAADVGLRISLLVEERPDLEELMAALASSHAVSEEVNDFLEHAQALLDLDPGPLRDQRLAAIAELRSLTRLRATGNAVLADIESDETDDPGFSV